MCVYLFCWDISHGSVLPLCFRLVGVGSVFCIMSLFMCISFLLGHISW